MLINFLTILGNSLRTLCVCGRFMPYTRCCKSFKNTNKMEKYYFKTTGLDNGTCTEKCKVKNNGVMIGSVKCQQCEFCVEHQKPCEFTGDVDWIKCSKLNEARK